MTPIQSPKAASIGLPEPVPIPAFDLSKVIAALPDGALLQLPAGTFTIAANGIANRFSKNGVTIRGSGYQRTIIQRDPNPAFYINNQPVLWLDGNDNTVEDLTLDANAGDNDPYSRACLYTFGRNPVVRRVRGIHASGTENECFAFFINPPRNDPDGGGLIDQCTLSDCKGTYVEGFCVSGACKVRNCHVSYPILTNAGEEVWFGGYQAAYSYGASFEGCSQVGGQAFLYTDTGSDIALHIANCTAVNVMRGIIIYRQADQFIDALSVDNCLIELSPAADSGRGSNGIAISGPGAKRNCRFTNNLIRYVGGVAPLNAPGLSIAVVDGTCAGTVITGNAYDPAMAAPRCERPLPAEANTLIARAVPAPGPTAPEK